MKTIAVSIKGITPLLQHRFTERNEMGSTTRRQVIEETTPRVEAEKVAYVLPNGTHYFPGAAIARLLREAGSNHKMKGTRRSAKFAVPAAVIVANDTVPLTNGDGKTPVKSFEVDSRPVTIPATKGRIMRHRPRHECWSAAFVLKINEQLLGPSFVNQLLTEGGQQIGIGDFRPEKGGPFGTFIVTQWEEV